MAESFGMGEYLTDVVLLPESASVGKKNKGMATVEVCVAGLWGRPCGEQGGR